MQRKGRSIKKKILHLFRKYTKGEATSAEQDFVDSIYDYIGSSERQNAPAESTKEEIKSKIDQQIGEQPKKLTAYVRLVNRAAAFLIMASVSLLVWKNQHESKPSHSNFPLTLRSTGLLLLIFLLSYVKINKNAQVAFSNPVHAFSNYSSTTKRFYFPDSSSVLLAPNTAVKYSGDYASNRLVTQLNGKAVYSVRKNKSNTFRVINQGIETKAIGTKFTVNALPENLIHITLLEGKIVVQDIEKIQTGEIFLRARQTLKINPKTFAYSMDLKETTAKKPVTFEEIKSKINSPRSTVSWTNTEIKFLKIENQELFQVIERVFDVTVLADEESILHGNFTGSLYRGDDLETLIGNFCQLNNCTFQLKDNIIEITKMEKGHDTVTTVN